MTLFYVILAYKRKSPLISSHSLMLDGQDELDVESVQDVDTVARSALHIIPFYHVSFRKKITTAHIRMVNGSTRTQVYKIKTTSNELFEVDPVMGDLGPFESVSVSIRFKGTPPTEEEELEQGAHMVHIYNAATEAQKDLDVEKVWESVKKERMENAFDGHHKLTCIFEDDCVSGASEPDVWSEPTDAEITDKETEGYDWDQDQWELHPEFTLDMNYESEHDDEKDHWIKERVQERLPIPRPEGESSYMSVMEPSTTKKDV